MCHSRTDCILGRQGQFDIFFYFYIFFLILYFLFYLFFPDHVVNAALQVETAMVIEENLK